MGFSFTDDGELLLNIKKFANFIGPYAIVGMVSFLLGVVVCFVCKKKSNSIDKIYNSFKEKSIENIVFFVAIILVLLSIVLQCFRIMDGFSNTVINIFGTLIVSWIATKKTSEEEARKKEQENAKKSRRYLNSIKITATNATEIILESIENKNLSFTEEQIIVLHRAKDQMEHIKAGIETSLFDWEDMMSKEDINMAHMDDEERERKVAEAMKTVPRLDRKTFEKTEQINQEEA